MGRERWRTPVIPALRLRPADCCQVLAQPHLYTEIWVSQECPVLDVLVETNSNSTKVPSVSAINSQCSICTEAKGTRDSADG